MSSHYIYKTIGGVQAGFIEFMAVGQTCEIVNLEVLPTHRRQGIGQWLMGALLQQTNAKQVHLEVRRSNAAGIALYTKLGFVPTGVRRDYYPALRPIPFHSPHSSNRSTREDAITMRWG